MAKKVLSKSSKKAKVKSNTKPKMVNEEISLIESTRNRIFNFLELNDTKRIAIISDNDQDGVTSAAHMKKFLDSKKIESMVFFYDHYGNKLSFPLESFEKFSPEKTIFLDLNEGFVSSVLLKIGKSTGPFLVIDHHEGSVLKNGFFRSMVIKPKSFSEVAPSRYPTTKMVFDLFGGIDWACEIGIIGDFAFEQWADFLRSVEKRYDFSYAKFKGLDDLVACITSQYPEKINSLFELIYKSKNPRGLQKSDFVALKKLFDAKLAEQKKRFDENAECYEDTQVCFFHSEPRFSSKLSNIISMENPSKVIIIFEQPGQLVKCSIRRQDFKVDCNALAKFAVSASPNGNGGGHIPAAGATFPVEYFEDFKKRVRLYLLENPPKQGN
jgi:single-stranded DNA-specific DHH superfamily exonuclease